METTNLTDLWNVFSNLDSNSYGIFGFLSFLVMMFWFFVSGGLVELSVRSELYKKHSADLERLRKINRASEEDEETTHKEILEFFRKKQLDDIAQLQDTHEKELASIRENCEATVSTLDERYAKLAEFAKEEYEERLAGERDQSYRFGRMEMADTIVRVLLEQERLHYDLDTKDGVVKLTWATGGLASDFLNDLRTVIDGFIVRFSSLQVASQEGNKAVMPKFIRKKFSPGDFVCNLESIKFWCKFGMNKAEDKK